MTLGVGYAPLVGGLGDGGRVERLADGRFPEVVDVGGPECVERYVLVDEGGRLAYVPERLALHGKDVGSLVDAAYARQGWLGRYAAWLCRKAWPQRMRGAPGELEVAAVPSWGPVIIIAPVGGRPWRIPLPRSQARALAAALVEAAEISLENEWGIE